MKKKLKKFIFCLLCSSVVFTLAACETKTDNNKPSENLVENEKMKYSFRTDTQGWEGGFADLPVNHEKAGYDVEFNHSDIPVNGKEDKGILLKGNNHSDDLFMYITKRLDKDNNGLESSTHYTMKLSFDMATNVAEGMMGIGGSPGQSVYVKAGITSMTPKEENVNEGEEHYYRMNIDKGNQASSGEHMIVIGNVEKEDSDDESFQYKHFEHTFEVTTNNDGDAFVIIGIDSGFEGITELYFTNIELSIL